MNGEDVKKLMLEVELEYDDQIMPGDDEESVAWFWNNVLLYPGEEGGLILHSNEIGDEVGTIKVLKVREP